MSLPNNPTPSELVKEVKSLDTLKANVSDVPVEYGTGRDSVTNKTTLDPTDVDMHGDPIDRSNTVEGAFASSFGSRNVVDVGSSETLVSGGVNDVTHSEDALVSGYENTIERGHQSIIGGYNNTVKASESVVVGDSNTVEGTISSNKTNTKAMAVFGDTNDIKANNKYGLVAGQDNEMKANGKWNFMSGAHHKMGQNNECVNLLGWTNTTNSYLTDSTLAGYDNLALGGSSGNNTYSVYMFGHDNNNQNPNNVTKGLSEIYQIGHGLRAKHGAQVILGKYNIASVVESDDVVTVGCGTGDSARADCFGTGVNSNGKYIRIGSTTLLESKLSDLVQATIPNIASTDVTITEVD